MQYGLWRLPSQRKRNEGTCGCGVSCVSGNDFPRISDGFFSVGFLHDSKPFIPFLDITAHLKFSLKTRCFPLPFSRLV